MPEMLAKVPPLPEGLSYVWDWWTDLFTGQTLTYSEIHAWSMLRGLSLRGWEAELLKDIDRTFWSVRNG